MAAKLEHEIRGRLLVVRLRGTVGFESADLAVAKELTQLLQSHARASDARVLVDLSEAHFVYPSSYAININPLLDPKIVGPDRVAVVLGGNAGLRDRFRLLGLERAMDIFTNEADAILHLELT